MKTVSESILKALEKNAQGDVTTQEIVRDDERFLVVVLPLPGKDELDRPWKRIFIEWLRRGLTIEKAAHLSGVSRRHAHHCRNTDLKFRYAWETTRNQKKM